MAARRPDPRWPLARWMHRIPVASSILVAVCIADGIRLIHEGNYADGAWLITDAMIIVAMRALMPYLVVWIVGRAMRRKDGGQ